MRKLKCIDNSTVEDMLTLGAVYTYSHTTITDGTAYYHLAETKPSAGWYPSRFAEMTDDDFARFMDKVMKPVKLDQPIAA